MMPGMLLLLGLGIFGATPVQHVEPPWPTFGVLIPERTPDKQTPACAAVPAPMTGTLEFTSRYRGDTRERDTIDPEADAEYRAATADLREFEKQVVSLSDDFLESGDATAARCGLAALERWASARAMQEPAENHTGRAVRKWGLASFASAYLKLKPAAPRRQQRRIETWLARLADLVVAEWSDRPDRLVNNHDYWAAWAVGVTAAALDDVELLNWSNDRFLAALARIDDDGLLPNELRRRTRAVQYLNYALGPLVMLAELLERNDRLAWEADDQALQRLVAAVLAALQDPTPIARRVEAPQTLDDALTPWHLAWLHPYGRRFPQRIDADVRALLPPNAAASRLGGRMQLLYPESRR